MTWSVCRARRSGVRRRCVSFLFFFTPPDVYGSLSARLKGAPSVYHDKNQGDMNVDTLLEAAKFIELQEEKEKLRLNHTSEISASRPAPLQNQIQTAATPALIRATRQDLPTTTTTMTVTAPTPTPRIINNSFDIINPLVIDEGGEQKRKQPPMVFRSGTREVHNKLEKHRRAHLKECFDTLKKQLPKTQDERKSSNLSILHSALRYISSLKKRERELEHEMERLARDKISYQQKLAILKKEVTANSDGIDLATLLPEIAPQTPPSLHQHHHHHHHHQDSQLLSQETAHEIKNGIVTDNSGVVLEQKLLKQTVVQRPVIPAQINGVKESAQVQTTALSVVPVSYPMSQGLVLQKVAFVPKGLADLSPLVSTNPTVATFIAAPQQLGGKVVPIVNAQYVVKPVVVVSTPSRPS